MQCFQLIDDFYFLEISVLINSVSAVHIFMCSTFLYLRFLLVWALVLMADFILEFRFEYLWPFWLMLRSVCDSFKYQGLVCNRFLILRFFWDKDFVLVSELLRENFRPWCKVINMVTQQKRQSVG